MDNNKEKELVKRIAKLAKQNQELEELIKKLERKNEKAKSLLEKRGVDKVETKISEEKKPRALKFEMATVLFADIHGLSRISDKVDSEVLMDELDEIIFTFNSIVKKYNIEKIKTIGDTVNNASRVESVAEVGDILISVMTYELVKEFFVCEYYGKLPVKYKGDLEMYKVNSIKPELSINGKGITPNKTFNIKFGLIQFTDIQEIILDKLEKELPKHLYYHNVKHTVDVVTEVELIGWGESIDDEEILLIKTAGLFHDVGHVVEYANHEYEGTKIAREVLPEYNYTQEQIDRICDIIMATKLPPKPKDKLQSIICDADLDYLGRSDFIPVSNTLYKELQEQNMIGSLNDWNKLQVKFISGHQYFTKTARNLREVNKQKQIERISSLIEE